MQISPQIYVMHIDDGAASHPGGSNNYFVGNPAEEMVLIDTGDHQRRWTDAILDFYSDLGRPKIGSVLITHGHSDHIGGLDRVHEAVQAPVRCHPELAGTLQAMLGEDRAVIPLQSQELIKTGGGVTLQALFTPGHAIDHVCYYAQRQQVMFTGDTVLGASSTSVVDLANYMKSLELLTRFEHDTVCPAHGPVVAPPRGNDLVRWQIEHRLQRERQVLAALANGLGSVEEISQSIYPKNLKKSLRQTADRNVATHLQQLVAEGKVIETAASFKIDS